MKQFPPAQLPMVYILLVFPKIPSWEVIGWLGLMNLVFLWKRPFPLLPHKHITRNYCEPGNKSLSTPSPGPLSWTSQPPGCEKQIPVVHDLSSTYSTLVAQMEQHITHEENVFLPARCLSILHKPADEVSAIKRLKTQFWLTQLSA